MSRFFRGEPTPAFVFIPVSRYRYICGDRIVSHPGGFVLYWCKISSAPNCLPLAELEGKMPLAADEV